MSLSTYIGSWLSESGIVHDWNGWSHLHFEDILQMGVAGVLLFFGVYIAKQLKEQPQENNFVD